MRLLFHVASRVSGEPRRCAAHKIWRVRAICGQPLCRLTNRVYLPYIQVNDRYRSTGFADMDFVPLLTDLLASRAVVIAFVDRLEPRIRSAREDLARPLVAVR